MPLRSTAAVTQATTTGMKLRGFHSNSSNSTASSTAAIGVPNTAVMPAAAPATNNAFARAAGSHQLLRPPRGNVEQLREQGADGAAGHDDRSLGAERSAGADGDRR